MNKKESRPALQCLATFCLILTDAYRVFLATPKNNRRESSQFTEVLLDPQRYPGQAVRHPSPDFDSRVQHPPRMIRARIVRRMAIPGSFEGDLKASIESVLPDWRPASSPVCGAVGAGRRSSSPLACIPISFLEAEIATSG
jgi:hypothetical protein